MDDAERTAVIEDLARSRIGYGLGDGDGAAGLSATRRSPACGDEVTMRVDVADGILIAVRWEGHGCQVSMAAASALADTASGLELREFANLAGRYLESVAPGGSPVEGGLEVFAGIGRFPLRAGCATLSWRAVLAALG
jgi:nitrogen fixation NifU-like protein